LLDDQPPADARDLLDPVVAALVGSAGSEAGTVV